MGSVIVKLRSGLDNAQKIYIHINYGRKKQLRYATGLSVQNMKHCYSNNNTVKNVNAEPNSNTINKDLTSLLSFSRSLIEGLGKK
jgi:hypothetical protein